MTRDQRIRRARARLHHAHRRFTDGNRSASICAGEAAYQTWHQIYSRTVPTDHVSRDVSQPSRFLSCASATVPTCAESSR